MTAGCLTARHVWLGPGCWLSPGLLRWDARGRLVAVARASRRDRIRDCAVFPGLVDAHVHLQLGALPCREPRFLPWVRSVMAARRASADDDLQQQAVASLQHLLADGVTAVGEIDSSGLSPAALRQVPLGGRCYQEVTGFHLDAAAARQLVRGRWLAGTAVCAAGLSPHAPYSVSPALFAAAAARGRHLSVHTAETPEEQRFLHRGDGPFADLLAELGRLPAGCRPPGCGAVRWLDRLGVLRPTTQLVHCQELERGDRAAIAASGAAVTVCPGTIEYFGRTPPPIGAWLAAGIPVSLGTDSLASNRSLSMRDELRLAARQWPDLSAEELLSMATRHGGRAIGRPRAGRLCRGGAADFFCVAADSRPPTAILEAVTRGMAPVAATYLGGRRHRSPGDGR